MSDQAFKAGFAAYTNDRKRRKVQRYEDRLQRGSGKVKNVARRTWQRILSTYRYEEK